MKTTTTPVPHFPPEGGSKNSIRIPKWDKRYLRLAREVSSWSKDPSTGVGAVIVDKRNRLVSMGFNGLPRKIKDDMTILNNREMKLRMTIHAEVNAIHFAKQDIEGCTLYTYPIPPCINCASSIIQEGVSRVVTVANEAHNPRWVDENATACKMFKEAGIEYVQYDRNLLK